MLALTYVVHLLADELSCLRAGRFSFALIFPRPLDGLLIGHSASLVSLIDLATRLRCAVFGVSGLLARVRQSCFVDFAFWWAPFQCFCGSVPLRLDGMILRLQRDRCVREPIRRATLRHLTRSDQ